jgi:hypothetical protein
MTRSACAIGIAAVVTLGSMPAAAQQTAADSAARDSVVRDSVMRDSVARATMVRDSVVRDSLMRDSTARARRVTSSQRIPVRKEAGVQPDTTTTSTGVVAPDTTMRDTTMAIDTTPVDTTMADTTMADTTMRDTTAAVTVPPPTPDTAVTTPVETRTDLGFGRGVFGNGFYIGIGGGGTVPMGDLSDAYGTGFNVTVPIGWQSMTTPWGVRADLAYNRVKGEVAEFDDGQVELDDGTIWSGTLGLTAQWPVGASSTSFYLVGGGGAYHFRDFGELNASGTEITIEEENVTKFGLNGGLGINFAVGAADIFVEGRYVSVFTDGDNTNYIPIVLGVRFF